MTSEATVDQIFEEWLDLKFNTRVRVTMWLKADAPFQFPYIDNVPSLAESAAPIMARLRGVGYGERHSILARCREQLKQEGVLNLDKAPQVPNTKWNLKRLKGAKKIEWLPGAVDKE